MWGIGPILVGMDGGCLLAGPVDPPSHGSRFNGPGIWSRAKYPNSNCIPQFEVPKEETSAANMMRTDRHIVSETGQTRDQTIKELPSSSRPDVTNVSCYTEDTPATE